MIRELVALSLKFRVVVLVLAAALFVVAVTQLRGASVDPYPEFGPPQVQVRTEAPGLSAAEVEQLITVPLEKDLLNGLPGLHQIQSESVPGLSSVDLIFDAGTDVALARQEVQEQLTQARALPNFGTPPIMLQPLSSTSRVMMVGLSSKDASLVDLSILARWKIRPRLMGVPGVANVAIWGQRDRQLQVQVDPARLRQSGVSLTQVIDTAGNALWVSPLTFVQASTPGSGGFIDTATQRFEIQHMQPITSAKALSSVTVEGSAGRLRLSDVTSVVEGNQPLIGDAILNNGPGLMLVIERFPNANTRDVTRGVEQAFEALSPGLTGVQVDTNVYRADSFALAAARSLGLWGLVGLLLLLAVLALVQFSWRATLVSAATILLSLVAATYLLYLRGATFNLMALAGILVALGVIIDDAVVSVSRTARALREGRSGGDAYPATVVARAAATVRGPLVYATLVILLAPLPLLVIAGVPGSFAGSLVTSYVLAVLTSTVVALVVAPGLAFALLRNAPPRRHQSPLGRWGRGVFDRTAPRYVARPRLAYLTLLLLVAGGLAVVPQLGGRPVLPAAQDRNLMVRLETVPGTSLTDMTRVVTGAAGNVRAIPGVRQVSAHVGRAVSSDQVVNVNSGEMWVNLADSADYATTVTLVSQALRGYAGLRSDVLTYPEDRLRAAQTGSADPLVVRVYGQDLALMREKAQQLRDLMATVPGVVRPKLEPLVEQPTLQVQVNLLAAQRYGLKPGDVRRAAAAFFSGLPVGSLYEDQKVFDVVVWGAPGTRYTPSNVSDLRIDAPTGGQVRLADVASVQVVPFPTVIRHDATFRSLDISAEVGGRDLTSVLHDVAAKVATVPMPLEYDAEVLSQRAARDDQDRRLLALTAAIAVAIFLLLQAAFGNWRLAAVIFLTLPLAGVGGIVAAFLTGGIMSLGALVGFFAVLAIATRHTILLARDYQRLEADDEASRGLDLVLRATRERVGPVLLTAVSTAAAVLPLALFGSTMAAEILYPLAAVVIGGLLTSTVLTLFVVPALYIRLSPVASAR